MESFFSRFDFIPAEDNRQDDTSLDSSAGSAGSDSASQTASQGPSHVGPILRRRSTQERSDDEDEDPADEAAHKRLRAYSRAASSREGLAVDSLEWFAVVSIIISRFIYSKIPTHALSASPGLQGY